MKFKNAKEMLDLIQSGTDLYNVRTGDYVFLYSNEYAIAAYNFDIEYAKELSSHSAGEYWGALLGFGGSIYEDGSELKWCEEHYNETGWEITSALDKEWSRSRKIISVVRHNGRYFMGFGLTVDKARQAAVNEANDFCGEDYTVEDYIKNYGEPGFEVLKWRDGCGHELDID